MFKFFVLFLFYIPLLFAQNESHTFDLFTAEIQDNLLSVRNLDSVIIYQKRFNDPTDMTADLDGDGIDEYFVTDALGKNGSPYFTVFIYNTIDSFYLADSIFSGLMEPYITESEDINGKVLVTGNSVFDSLNTDTSNVFLPVDCWRYSDGKVELVNNIVYDVFISENDNTIDFIDKFYKGNSKKCNSTKQILAALASVYINYLNASENVVANQFLDGYYFCEDKNQFKTKIINLMKVNK